ncbi:MAG: hypothetical protein Q7K43_02745, partial [Candidatus Woesearchaeota archaeon]|nr:hypothetical protein [Candidatus Woesearchaeota archaeon]
ELNSEVVAAVFQHKNQTTRNALLHSASKFGLEKTEMKEAVEKLEPKLIAKRVRELTIPELLELGKQVNLKVK